MSQEEGRVAAVCVNDKRELCKYPVPFATAGIYGFDGDRHAGALYKDRKSNEVVPNIRQITIIAKEVVDAVSKELNIIIPPGGLGENLLVKGFGDLSDLRWGEIFEFEAGVVLTVTGQNDPCKKIMVYHKLLVKKIYGKRGVTAIVTTLGIISSGEKVILKR